MHPQQLDIFDHSRDTVLCNDVAAALERREAVSARSAWDKFAGEFPDHDSLAPLCVLVDALEQRTATPFQDHESAHRARRALGEVIEPAALRIFGARSGSAWLVTLWRALAQRASPLPFRPERSDDHAAALWLRAGDWAAASDAVARIESWRRIPASLAWMAEARYRVHDLDDAWGLLAELAWLSCDRFDQLTKRLADPLLERLRKRFDATFEGHGDVRDLAWFPAWILTEKPALSRPLSQAQRALHTEPEKAMRLLLEMLGLERQGRHHDVVARRKALRDAHPSLYAAYMKTR
ncbi:hypothetical protein C7T35_27575 [Variovorax sp. WS11]|uniref:hypothetical protein n=1 Tax=Variovorax sp. WS11 TaxID=1105204 RepID=UPI000D0DAE81|nr:hypothetical protein [Variovorax sp. WS11]NDZ16926.1 hypothetical protein [Variovorax sp. WS11]PSL81307.1 hypothetical protein C7T35_27575 [Variovorax sp. WS11]